MKKTILFLSLTAMTFIASAQEKTTTSALWSGVKARQIGPASMSGRISDIDAVESNPQIVYVGSAGGGVWKSNSGGVEFMPVFNDYAQSIGKVTIDQKHPDTVWVGTGESWVRNSVSVGDGIYVTYNAGSTWTKMGLENTEHIADILIDPTNSNTIYAAALGHLWNANPDRGLYKTTDGGKTWNKILFIDENTGCSDIAIDPNDPNVLYAATWQFRRYPDFFESGGKGSALYKSTDGGKTWNKIHNGLPTGDYGRIAIGLAPSNPKVLYISLEAEKKEDKAMYKSEDAGASWKKISDEFNTKVRPFYFSKIVVDPGNEKIVYKCGLNLIFSEDGGKSFRGVGSGVHSDIHAVWVNPKNSKHTLIGTDGGFYRTLDGSRTYEMCMSLPISQFYHVETDNQNPYNVYGGLQDNGSWFAPTRSGGGIENKDWEMSCYGDGFWSVPHPTDNNIVYSESQGGDIVRFNKKDGTAKDIKPVGMSSEPEYRFNWNTPIHVSPNNPERLYLGAQFLFMSMDRGDSWTKISPDLTSNDSKRQRKDSGGLSRDKTSAENNTTIYTMQESSKNEKIIWVGTDDGMLQVTADGGKKWTNTAGNTGVPAFTWVSDVEPSHHDANTCYVTFDGHRNGDMKTYIYKTADLGKTWTLLATPDIKGFAWTIKEDLKNPNLLFLGTEFGLFISIDGGKSWAKFENSFPAAAVHDMSIQPREDALVCATHGRGIIIIDDISAIRALTPEIIAKEFHIFPSKPAIVRYERGGEPFGGAGNFAAGNPEDAAMITYYMKKRHTFGKMEIEVTDANGKLIQTLPAGKASGINIVALPTRLPMPKAAPTNSRQAIGNSIFGPALPDGTYNVKIKKGKEEFTSTVIIQHEEGTPYKPADRQIQHDLLMKLYNLTEQLGWTYYALEDMHKGAEKLKLTDIKLTKEVEDFGKKAKELKDGIVSLEGDFYVDEGENLREKLSKIYGTISRYPGKPTESQQRKAQEMEKEVNEVIKKFNDLQKTLESLNSKLTAATATPIKIRTFEEFKNK